VVASRELAAVANKRAPRLPPPRRAGPPAAVPEWSACSAPPSTRRWPASTARSARGTPTCGRPHLHLFRFGTIEGRRVTELAILARMTKQSMHELVTNLERCGYLRRKPDPANVRARLIRLTDRGRQLEDDVVATVHRTVPTRTPSGHVAGASRRSDAPWRRLVTVGDNQSGIAPRGSVPSICWSVTAARRASASRICPHPHESFRATWGSIVDAASPLGRRNRWPDT
jgi:DNA-binding MarR family transcriptional regulator